MEFPFDYEGIDDLVSIQEELRKGTDQEGYFTRITDEDQDGIFGEDMYLEQVDPDPFDIIKNNYLEERK